MSGTPGSDEPPSFILSDCCVLGESVSGGIGRLPGGDVFSAGRSLAAVPAKATDGTPHARIAMRIQPHT